MKPAADDSETIARRIAELQAERDAARKCTCDVREDDSRIVNPTCPTHSQSAPPPAAMQHFDDDDWQRLKQEKSPVPSPLGTLRERRAEFWLIRHERLSIVPTGDLCPHHPESTMLSRDGRRWCSECDWQVEP